ncbi:Hypothetical protein AJAP_27910 [Amycolatopsis japonica]|uniref:Uncharacterized protein n=1 Tax=Amycolatopsis japonica TaxID=208439 RepID=A0A075V179_9PSEU|nr:hypothetical protein [Amycolatopsis japonica]AIG78426.1 Hypothetical protein AJAP_27910 [Amycolatopsis japonica]
MSNYVDPFADDETQNAPAPETTAGPWEESKAEKPATPPVVVGGDGKVVVTLKGGKEYDKPWVVIHASDIDDALGQLRHEKIKDLLKVTQSAANFFTGGSGGAGASGAPQQRQQSQGGGQSRQAGKPDGADGPPAGTKQEYCKHGEMVFRSGFSEAKQKTWKGFFCPTPKGTPDQCKAVFLR